MEVVFTPPHEYAIEELPMVNDDGSQTQGKCVPMRSQQADMR